MSDTLNPATLLSRRFRFEEIPDLKGKVALVTGGSAGKNAEAEINENIKQAGSAGSVTWYGCDLGNLKEVDGLAKKLAQELDQLDILICNAAIGQAPYGLTEDGLERHFEVNNLSHYVLVNRLLPIMKKTAETAPPASVRIVMQSSEMHRVAPSGTQFASKDEINKDGDGSQLYGRTKLGLILLAKQLVKRKLDTSTDGTNPILAISVHPGTVDTEVQKSWVESYGSILGKALEVFSTTVGKSAPEGAEASLWAATSTDIGEGNWREYQGNYYTEAYGKPGKETKQAKDEQLGDNFWNLCSELAMDILGDDVQ
ncbi:unnamed protein product [Somion occarium]|uniref:NAD(P)-binding protein n=1 Tax=Somion occarium TaxID=3059160 RepID=A0ABP1DN29_9APHY